MKTILIAWLLMSLVALGQGLTVGTNYATINGGLNITSTSANAITNVAVTIDSSTGWTNKAHILNGNNGGTNQFYVASDGSLAVGRSVASAFGNVTASPLTAIYDRTKGDPKSVNMQFDNIVDGSTYTERRRQRSRMTQ